ncbi:AMP-binding protein [Chitinispirillales bacterium ANBcel5]|uniref:class I adenylate-forming enzyme family protein n=1 Tax=Cellulosispirillum alkaliphilum TaxID=3039283 RepID=UPI002A562D9D|nr:AMP-binding protein [Chitinispirillales bacterium ANBcel5]
MLLGDFLTHSAEKFTQKTAIVQQSREISYGQLNNKVNCLANSLVKMGIKKQDRVAVYLENSIESVISIFAILKAGGVFLVINPQVKSKKLFYILNDCQVRLIITDLNGKEQVAQGGIDNATSLTTIILTAYEALSSSQNRNNIQNSTYNNTIDFNSLLEVGTENEPDNRSIDIDLASLTYTSGSTNEPKGVMLTHQNMVTAATSITQYLENTNTDIVLNYLPLSFDYGLYQALMTIKFGGTLVLEKAFVYPFQAIQKIKQFKVTGFPIVPAMVVLISVLKNINPEDLSSVRYITNTGQALALSHIEALEGIFPSARIYSMYGLTECKRVTYLPPAELKNRPLSVGKAIPNTEVWLVDENGNKINEPHREGELVIRGAHVMKGYWNKEGESKKVLKKGIYPGEKVLMSGDFFKMDEEGYLYFISRKDEIIKSGAERVSPKEIEDVLYGLSGVEEVAVIGVPDKILGNALKAFLVFKEGKRLSKDQILDFCSIKLERNRIPKHFEIMKSLPKSNNGKIRKKGLYEQKEAEETS